MVQDYDSPWKDAIGLYFEQLMLLLFPFIHRIIDWSKGYEPLDKEFSSIVREGHRGTVLADKLFLVYLKSGRRVRLYIHLEVQARRDRHFPRRMFVYHYRIVDLYGDQVISVAILADESPDWRPTEYVKNHVGTNLRFEFPTVKLLDWADREEELLASDNPIAVVILAHLHSQATRNDPVTRYQSKWRLLRNLYERGWEAETLRQLFRLVDWLMTLPPELDEKLQTDITAYEQEKQMPYVPTYERAAREEGRREGEAAAKAAEAVATAAKEALHEGLILALELKFGKPGIAFAKQLKKIKDLDVLREVQRGIRSAKTVDELRHLAK